MPGHRPVRRRAALALADGVVLVAALVHPAAAVADDTCTVRWNGGSGSWTDPARWSPARVPAATDDVCVVRAAGAAPVSVRLPASTAVDSATLRGATLAVATGTFLDVAEVVADHAVLTGGGDVRGSVGIVDLQDSRLAGIHVHTPARLTLGGQLLVTGGATLDGSGTVDLLPGLRIVDGDGNGANHVAFSHTFLEPEGPLFVGVPLGLAGTSLDTGYDVVLAALDDLDADGRLGAAPGTALTLDVVGDGSLTLPRSVTSIGSRVTVTAGDIRTRDGHDALTGLTAVDGTLTTSRPLTTAAPVVVRGSLLAGATLAVPTVTVGAKGRLVATRVDGAVSCAGTCDLTGARVGRLTLAPGATTTTAIDRPVTVDGTARLAGRLVVTLPDTGGPRTGSTLVLITAAHGVTGTFGAVTTDRPGRAITPDYRPTYVTGTLGSTA